MMPATPSREPLFQSRRSTVMARRGMVASSQPLASQAGLSILMAGGNAADAAVAMAAALNVTEPCSTGIGGDCFALYYDAGTRKVAALNGSGRAPAALSIEVIRSQGLEKDGAFRNPFHAHTATVPGACAGWCDMIKRYGTMSLYDVLFPAIRLAEDGFPVSPLTSVHWSHGAEGILASAPGGRALTIGGRGPREGEIFRNPGLARTFHAVIDDGKAGFYQRHVARDIVKAVQEAGGVMSLEDLARHASTWEEPISVPYRGMRVWECPPNGQGLAALLALSILDGFDLGALAPLSAERWHLVVEAMRLGFADALRFVADPAVSPAPIAELLSETYAAGRRRLIDHGRAMEEAHHGTPGASGTTGAFGTANPGTDTVYFCAADRMGNACSFINSNYMGFGTGIVPGPEGKDWGFTLQNRGMNFSLDPSHPNALAPRKRPYHTIIPGMITRADGSLYCPFGVMGGFMQPQGHVQVVTALLDDHEDPQAALDRPRFYVDPQGTRPTLHLEDGVSAALAGGLAALGHAVSPLVSGHARAMFGRGQVILRDEAGVYRGGSDPRADGCAMGF
jgi:gamma-glutamyltranspeptidase/glutathione hydrolase